jgi:UDP-GlcNAc3NAcA epimerase
MKRLLTIIGARPQIIKAAALNRAIRTNFSDRLSEILVHTGQHYDHGMSDVFFEQMGIPQPHHQLGIGSGGHGEQTGKMLAEIERTILLEKPDAVVVYGDTNSTLAGALAAVKIHVPVIHIEAGLRSFNKSMPEEVNRITADHASTLLFSPTGSGADNLKKEGFLSVEQARKNGKASVDNPYVFQCGDLMYDNTLFYSKKADDHAALFEKHGIDRENYILSTIHRPSNTDDIDVLLGILSALNEISVSDGIQIVMPLHPRTANVIRSSQNADLEKIRTNERFSIIEPVGFLEMTLLEKHAKLVMTDSGGVQKEAFFMKKPCIILRLETEWTEIVDSGCAILSGSETAKILSAYRHFSNTSISNFPNMFGDGKAAEFICEAILANLD